MSWRTKCLPASRQPLLKEVKVSCEKDALHAIGIGRLSHIPGRKISKSLTK